MLWTFALFFLVMLVFFMFLLRFWNNFYLNWSPLSGQCKWGFCIFQLNVSVIGLSSALVRYFRVFQKEPIWLLVSFLAFPFSQFYFVHLFGYSLHYKLCSILTLLFLFVCHHILWRTFILLLSICHSDYSFFTVCCNCILLMYTQELDLQK